MEGIIKEIFAIAPVAVASLLLVIYFLFKVIERRDKQIVEISENIVKSASALERLSVMIELLIKMGGVIK